MVRATIYVVLALALVVFAEASLRGECPLSSQHTSCSPKCLQDHECASRSEICCPNLCNAKSCVRPKVGGNYGGSGSSGAGGYKGSGSSSATGTYCGNRKCNSGEKCVFDKNTKRDNCMRT